MWCKQVWQIRELKEQELSLLFHYSSKEGWDNESLHTQALFHQHPHDFFIAYEQKNLIGFVIALKNSSAFGFISNLLILQEFRNCGFGRKLFNHALSHLKGLQIGLDSVIGQEAFYERAGFESYFLVSSYKFNKGSVTLPTMSIAVSDFSKEYSLENKDASMQELICNKATNYKAIRHKENSFALSFSYAQGYKIHLESEDINEALTLFFALVNEHNEGTLIYLQASPLSPLLEALVQLLKMDVHAQHKRMYNFIP